MVRFVVVAFALACLATSAGAQSPEMPTTGTFEPAPKRLPPRTEALGNQPGPTASGHCELGIIPIAGDQFAVQKVGFGTFGNETTRIRVDGWGFDDLVAARVRAAAPGHVVRRIVYARKELARRQQGAIAGPPTSMMRSMISSGMLRPAPTANAMSWSSCTPAKS